MPYDKNGKYFTSTGNQFYTGTHLGVTYVNGRKYGVGENDNMRITRLQAERVRNNTARQKKSKKREKCQATTDENHRYLFTP